MNYLVDTHIFLWWLEGDKRLKSLIKEILQDSGNQIFVSVISGVEISIKHRAKKLTLKTTIKRMFEISGFDVLNLNLNHILELDKQQTLHKDPFDRIIISQAQIENLTLITSDPKIWKYKIKLLKC